MVVLWVEINLKDEGCGAVDALALRIALERRLVAASAGTVIGGGASLDGSSCDLEVRCENPSATEALCRTILDDAGLGKAISFRPQGGR